MTAHLNPPPMGGGSTDPLRMFPASALGSGAVVSYKVDEDELAGFEHRGDFLDPKDREKRPDSPETAAWLTLLCPHFSEGHSLNFTGTYSDEYGYSHGLMLARNVERDFRRFLGSLGRRTEAWVLGVEHHRTGRKILHLHAVVAGHWSDADIAIAAYEWQRYRGFCRAGTVNDRAGAVRYAVKHAMKQGGAELLFWRFPSPEVSSPREYRLLKRAAKQEHGGQVARVVGAPHESPEGASCPRGSRERPVTAGAGLV
jgi:hypothetical protein